MPQVCNRKEEHIHLPVSCLPQLAMQLTAWHGVLLLAWRVPPPLSTFLLSCSLLCSQHEGHRLESRQWSSHKWLPGTALCYWDGVTSWDEEGLLLAQAEG